jgi:acyl-CoA thioester hydrolase
MSPPPVAAPVSPFVWPVRVYYEDTDAAGIVYYANYLRFLERGRTEWLRALGFDQGDAMREHGVAFVVRDIRVRFAAPARLDDRLEVSVRVVGTGHSRLVLAQEVCFATGVKEPRQLIEAKVEIACVRIDSMRPVRIPGAIRAAVLGATAIQATAGDIPASGPNR